MVYFNNQYGLCTSASCLLKQQQNENKQLKIKKVTIDFFIFFLHSFKPPVGRFAHWAKPEKCTQGTSWQNTSFSSFTPPSKSFHINKPECFHTSAIDNGINHVFAFYKVSARLPNQSLLRNMFTALYFNCTANQTKLNHNTTAPIFPV